MELHLRLETLRSERGVSVSEVARQIGESASTVQTWFNGRHLPKLDAAVKLADFFGVSLDDLAGRAEGPQMDPLEVKVLSAARDVSPAVALARIYKMADPPAAVTFVPAGEAKPVVKPAPKTGRRPKSR